MDSEGAAGQAAAGGWRVSLVCRLRGYDGVARLARRRRTQRGLQCHSGQRKPHCPFKPACSAG